MVLSNFIKSSTPRRTPRSASKSIKKVKESPKSNIKVVVRCRPPNDKELGSNHQNIIKFVDDQMLIFDPHLDQDHFYYHGIRQNTRDITKRVNKNLNFVFDHVFNYESTNSDIYEQSVKNILDSVMDGYNCSVFAYGATGAGKTFTMVGNEFSPGISYLTMVGLFNKMKEYDNRTFKLAITYVEVYNENVQDLLRPSGQLHLREEARGNVILSGVSIHDITSAEELIAMLQKGNLNRTQHPTDANSQSSRSHAVFQIHIRMKNNSSGVMQQMKLSMIDLAGSERASATSGVGLRFKEGANINKSLLALGNCINSLADGHSHIPYRDSKLTRLLKDSLGGNCKTLMIANISPSSLSFEDTYNTLKYATRAKSIQTTTSNNIIQQRKDLAYYVERVKSLEFENESLRKKTALLDVSSAKKQIKFESPTNEVASNSISEQFTCLFSIQKTLLNVLSSKRFLEYESQLKEDLRNIVKDIFSYHAENFGKILEDSKNQLDNQISALDSRLVSLGENSGRIYQNLQESIRKHKNDKLKISIDNEVLKLNFNALVMQLKHIQKLLHLEIYERKSSSDMFLALTVKLLQHDKILKDNSLLTKQMEEETKIILSRLQQMFKYTPSDDNTNLADSKLLELSVLSLEQDTSVHNSTFTLDADDTAIANKPMNEPKHLLENFSAQTINRLCNVNNILCENKAINITGNNTNSDSHCSSILKQSITESTFLIPAKVVQTKSLSLIKNGTQKLQHNVLKAPSNYTFGKIQPKLFKSPKGTPLKTKKENKENILDKKITKVVKSFGTMGTSQRFPPLNNTSIKTKISSSSKTSKK